MGLGDWLMAAGEARRVHYATGKRVVIMSSRGVPQWSPVFEGVPYIARQADPTCERVISASGQRPYIRGKFPLKWQWQAYQPLPAEIAFKPAELERAQPYHGAILIEPNVKDIGHRNKAWPWHLWRDVVDRILAGELGRTMRVVQCVHPGADRMSGCEFVETPSFRDALAVLSVCRSAVLPEGGLMHGAAAVGVPAVVLFGGFISPKVTGYALHRNIYTGQTELGCGRRMNCPCCTAAMQRITPAMVLANLKEIVG